MPADKIAKRHYYFVGIRKEYFPVHLQPPAKEMTAYFETVKVLAKDRIDAATTAWRRHGIYWLRLMVPDTTIHGNLIVSLEVNDPVRRISPGRLGGIKVYEGGKTK